MIPDSKLPKKRSDLKSDDCMALCPFADYFNHSEEGVRIFLPQLLDHLIFLKKCTDFLECKVTSDRSGFKVTCHKAYSNVSPAITTSC
jgi:hypothetical protein